MKKGMKRILFIISGLIILIAVIGTVYLIVMSEPALEGWVAGDPANPKKILIASSGSDFKKNLIRSVIGNLTPDKVFARVVDLEKLKTADPAPWRAIVILNPCEMYKMDSRVRAFLKKHRNSKKIVLLITSGNSRWIPKDNRFDAISGASKKQFRQKMLDSLTLRIRALLR